ncbi:DUF1205 domain-containing protein [Spirillospora sp. NBC_00431]
MRVMFVTSPVLSHIFPTVPLAHALLAAGHEVRYAVGSELHAVSQAGMHAADITPGLDYTPLWMAEGEEDPMYAEDVGVEFLAELFARVSGAEVSGVLDLARDFAPDLIVHSAAQGAAALVAAALRLPCVEVPLGPADSDPRLARLLRSGMRREYERHRVTGEPAATARINTLPPSLQHLLPGRSPGSFTGPDEWSMAYVPYNGGGELPDWLSRPSRPRLAVTLGSMGAQWGGITVLKSLFANAGSVDAEFVLTLGGGDVSLLGELPGNVRVVEWMPLAPLLKTCAGVIHHAGSGTLLTAMRLGVPQCVLPHGSYQMTNAAVLTGAGTGFIADPDTLGEAECERLLTDTSLRSAGARIGEEIRSLATPADLVPRMVALAA